MQDAGLRDALRQNLTSETQLLNEVYHRELYGGETMRDSALDGSHDVTAGALFKEWPHVEFLFTGTYCRRLNQESCFAEGTEWWSVTHHGIDPMVQRLTKEAELLALDAPEDINPHSPR